MALTKDEIRDFFQKADARIEGNRFLREPQIEGHAAALAHFAAGGTRVPGA